MDICAMGLLQRNEPPQSASIKAFAVFKSHFDLERRLHHPLSTKRAEYIVTKVRRLTYQRPVYLLSRSRADGYTRIVMAKAR
jgi:hypothetical protein